MIIQHNIFSQKVTVIREETDSNAEINKRLKLALDAGYSIDNPKRKVKKEVNVQPYNPPKLSKV